MSLRDGWAEMSIRLKGSELDLLEVPRGLQSAGELNKHRTALIIKIGVGREASLQTLLMEVQQFLEDNRDMFDRLPHGCSVDVFVGWSPRASQESATLSVNLLRVLAQISAEMVFDTYGD